MTAKNLITTARLDGCTAKLLESLTNDLNFSQSHVLRKGIHLLYQLIETRKKYGEIKLITGKGKDAKEIILLLS